MMSEKEFVSLSLPDSDTGPAAASASSNATKELNFLPSNYDYNNPKSSDNSENNSVLNFGETGNFSVTLCPKKNSYSSGFSDSLAKLELVFRLFH
jgi:hypothetical protein